jgi:hypothetical protein
LSSDGDIAVVWSVMYALSKIAVWPNGAEAILDATTLDHIKQFLESPDTNVRKWTSCTMDNLSLHLSLAVAFLGDPRISDDKSPVDILPN